MNKEIVLEELYLKLLNLTVNDTLSDITKAALLSTAIGKLFILATDIIKDQSIEKENDISSLLKDYPEIISMWLESELEFIYNTYPDATKLSGVQLIDIGINIEKN